MAPSTTTVTRSAAKRKESLASGKLNGNGVAKVNGRLEQGEREAIETKYKDFFWTYTEEPHRTRRLAIIKAHPEVHQSCSYHPFELVD